MSISVEFVCAQSELPPLSYYDVIEKRNIFKSNVEILDTTTEINNITSTEEIKSSVSNISLTGIVKIRGAYKAIIEIKDEQSGFYVREGEKINEFTVEKIKHDRINLEKDGKVTILKINIQSTQPKNTTETQDFIIEVGPTKNKLIETPKESFRANVIKNIRTGRINE